MSGAGQRRFARTTGARESRHVGPQPGISYVFSQVNDEVD
jgi:hypothetical protein